MVELIGHVAKQSKSHAFLTLSKGSLKAGIEHATREILLSVEFWDCANNICTNPQENNHLTPMHFTSSITVEVNPPENEMYEF